MEVKSALVFSDLMSQAISEVDCLKNDITDAVTCDKVDHDFMQRRLDDVQALLVEIWEGLPCNRQQVLRQVEKADG